MGGDDLEVCNTRLGLGIGLDDFVPKRDHQQQQKGNGKRAICFDLSFPFHFEEDQEMEIGFKTEGSSSKTLIKAEEERQSTTSINNDSNNNNNGGGVRKKLRLTKEQSTILEDSFRQHTTLNTAQKQALAEKLNLKPRQVEVWFQNRRARTKLKQTEVDCEFLKKCCENLSDENRRLKKEVQELRSSFNNMDKAAATATPFFAQLQKAATLAMCPSCDQKMVRSKGSCGGDNIVKHERSSMAAAADVVVHKPKQLQSGLKFLS